MIVTRTPYRVSFFGGGTDYPAWYRVHGGAVLATSIDKYCYISCRKLPPFFEHLHRIVYSRIETVKSIDEIVHPAVRAAFATMQISDGLEIHHDGDLPARSGLGSSSSFSVGLLHALHALSGNMVSKEQLAREAIHLEQEVIGETVGSQDQISAALGGFNKIEFLRDGSFLVNPIIAPASRVRELKNHLLLFFTGISRTAEEVAKKKIANFAAREAELSRIRAMVDEGADILCSISKPVSDFGYLLDAAWRDKRSLSSFVSNQFIDDIYSAARSEGAIGGKLLGAGGGGFLLLFAEPDRHDSIKRRLAPLVHVPFDFDSSGSKVVLFQPDGL